MKFLGVLVALTVAWNAYGAQKSADSCSHVFANSELSLPQRTLKDDNEILDLVRAEVTQARSISAKLQTYFTDRSNTLKKIYSGKTVVIDFLCIGAGPHCADASLVLGRTNNKSLVVERSSSVARVFAEKDFYINSTEDMALTMHEFAGGYGSLANLSSQQYSHSSQLAAYVQSQQKYSKVDVLLGESVEKVTRVVSKGETYYYVQTSGGLRFKVKNLLVGTGLGEVKTKVVDPLYKKMFENGQTEVLKNPSALPKITSTDAFLIALKILVESGQTVQLPRRIVLIGNGDGARIVLEALKNYGIQLPKNFQISWVGTEARSEEQFVLSMKGWPRYIKLISEFYRDGMVTASPGHVSGFKVSPTGVMSVQSTDKDSGAVTRVEGELVIDSTGYTATASKFLTQLGAVEQLGDVKGYLSEESPSSNLGRQAVLESGEKLSVYFLGSAAGVLATPEELANKPNRIGVSLYNTLGRTSKLASLLTGTEPLPYAFGLRSKRPPLMTESDWLAGLGLK